MNNRPAPATDIRAWLDARELDLGRCVAHPAYDADYCPICGTATVIGGTR